jgi:hypothetical protein
MADADLPIPAASGDRRIEATPVNLSFFADLTAIRKPWQPNASFLFADKTLGVIGHTHE